jgi:hypothetical protein
LFLLNPFFELSGYLDYALLVEKVREVCIGGRKDKLARLLQLFDELE